MKVKPGNEIKNKNKNENENENEKEKKFFIDFLKEHFDIDIKENVKNIKIYSGSNEIFDTEKYYNKNDTPVDSESNNIKD